MAHHNLFTHPLMMDIWTVSRSYKQCYNKYTCLDDSKETKWIQEWYLKSDFLGLNPGSKLIALTVLFVLFVNFGLC